MHRNPATEEDLEQTLQVAADAAEELGNQQLALALRALAGDDGPYRRRGGRLQPGNGYLALLQLVADMADDYDMEGVADMLRNLARFDYEGARVMARRTCPECGGYLLPHAGALCRSCSRDQRELADEETIRR